MSLELRDVRLRRTGTLALHNVSLALVPGQLHAVLGANGAGKSSLLHVLAGDLRPDTGHATLDSHDISTLDAGTLARRRAVLTQASLMDFDFSVRDLVGLGRLPFAGSDTPATHQRAVDWAIAITELAPLAAEPVTRLSGGQHRRAQLARVLAQLYPPTADTPRYLLLDEPTAGMDLRYAVTMTAKLRDLARQGLGILWVSHDVNLAARYADTVSLIAHGELFGHGPPAAALTRDTLERCYGVPMDAVEANGQRLWQPRDVDLPRLTAAD